MSTKGYVVRWNIPHARAYVTRTSPDRKPYSFDPHDPDTKVWKNRKAAERWVNIHERGHEQGPGNVYIIEEIEHGNG